MITRSHGQRNLFETVIGPIEKLVEGLVEPALERLDELLGDEQLLEAVAVQMAKRRPHSRTPPDGAGEATCGCPRGPASVRGLGADSVAQSGTGPGSYHAQDHSERDGDPAASNRNRG